MSIAVRDFQAADSPAAKRVRSHPQEVVIMLRLAFFFFLLAVIAGHRAQLTPVPLEPRPGTARPPVQPPVRPGA